MSRNEETGEDSYKKVTDILVRSTQKICIIELETGKIKSTTGHLFMVKDKWWKAAVELVAGDILLTSDGKEQVVKSIKVEEKGYPVTTYNLSVEDNHTFFVGNEKVLTHNTTKLLKKCNYTKETSESITECVSEAKYQVGAYKDIKGIGDFDAHHVGQKVAMKKLVDSYDPMTAPAINVPKIGHTIKGDNGIVSRNTKGITSGRQLLARDIKELRRVYPDIPNSKLQELIEMNKKLYLEMRKEYE